MGWEDEAAKIAQGDQSKAGMADLAQNLHAYCDSLIAAGFSRPEALVLTLNYQTTMIAAALQRQGRSES